MKTDCVFCKLMKNPDDTFFYEDSLFRAKWDDNPERPGHALVIPKRHIQFFHQLNEQELEAIAPAVEKAEEIIIKTDLTAMYDNLFGENVYPMSKQYIDQAKQNLRNIGNQVPQGFTDGINDGPVAGQQVPHLHWHIIPRWEGDVPNPGGGLRHIFDEIEGSE